MKIDVGSLSLNCTIEGNSSGPWLVFSNSIATNLALWDEQVEMLGDRFHILRYDQRGHGHSDTPSGDYTIELLADDLVKLLDALKIEKASVMGISMGAMTALTMGKTNPERVQKLVICDCGPAASPTSAQQWEERIKQVSTWGMQAIEDETIARWFSESTLAAPSFPAVNKVRKMITSTPVHGFIGCARALSTFDLRPGLEKMEKPCLFIAGEHDAVAEGTKKLSEYVADGRFAQIPSAGHLCNLENPGEFLAAVESFLDQDPNYKI